jgi:hypothetical protein
MSRESDIRETNPGSNGTSFDAQYDGERAKARAVAAETGEVIPVDLVEERKQQQRILELRRSHASIKQIADAIGISTLEVVRKLDMAMNELLPAEDIDVNRRLEADRIEQLQLRWLAQARKWFTAAEEKDLAPVIAVEYLDQAERATAQWLRLSESRRRLLGMDAPIRIAVEFHEVHIELVTIQVALALMNAGVDGFRLEEALAEFGEAMIAMDGHEPEQLRDQLVSKRQALKALAATRH